MATIPRRESDEEFEQLDEESLEPVANRRGAFATRNPGSRNVSLDEEAAAIERSLRRRGRVIPMIVAGLALIGFGAAIWFAYDRGLQPSEKEELVVIKADPTPEKEKPSDEGGLEIPDQDKLLLNEVPGGSPEGKVEQLLPEPETPLPPIPQESETAASGAEPSDDVSDGTQQAAKIIEEMAANEPEAPAVPVAPDPEAAQAEAQAAADKVAESSGVTPVPEAPKAAPKAPESPAEASATKKAASEDSSGSAQVAAKKAEPAAETKKAPAIASGDFVLQLASVGSKATAEQGWARMQKAHGGLLGNMSLSVEKADVKGKTYYRVLTGPFPNRATAVDMCAQLKARNQDCLVRKR